MKDNEIKAAIQELESKYGNYKSKCLRNLRMYTYSPNLSLGLNDSEVVGYYQAGYFDVESDTTSSIQENIIRSVIDTLTAITADKKVRPFFNTVNGTFKDMQIAKQAQIFFDQLYEFKNVTRTVVNVFRDACIFDKGIVKIGDEIEKKLPWNVFFDPKETFYGKNTKVVEKLENYPARLLKLNYNIDVKPSIKNVTVYEYYDIVEHVHAIYVLELNKIKTERWEPDVLPYIVFYYSDPVKGSTDQSVVDTLYGIQMQIDELLAVIKDSIQMNPGVTYFVPNGSGIKTNMLSNRTGQIITYDAMQGQPPVVTESNDIISTQFLQLLDQLKEDAYELVGISELSAQARKPTGLSSGVALESLENAEAGRHEVIINNVVRLYVDIAKRCIDIYPPESEILPPDISRSRLVWADIIEAKNQLNIQFSAATSLSKDPSTKLQQLLQLASAGVIPQSHVGVLMELPDLQSGYNIANNGYNAVLNFIDSVIESGVVPDIPVYLPQELLKDEIANTMLSLSMNPANAADLQLLYQLFCKIVDKQQNVMSNAENMILQQFSQQMQQQMPLIQQKIQQGIAKSKEMIDAGIYSTGDIKTDSAAITQDVLRQIGINNTEQQQ